MEIIVQKEGDICIISPKGELDAGSSIMMEKSLSDAVENDEKKILINCENLSYISSAGLGVFVSYINNLKAKKAHLILYGASEKVKNVFKILGLHEILNIKDTKEESLALFNETNV